MKPIYTIVNEKNYFLQKYKHWKDPVFKENELGFFYKTESSAYTLLEEIKEDHPKLKLRIIKLTVLIKEHL